MKLVKSIPKVNKSIKKYNFNNLQNIIDICNNTIFDEKSINGFYAYSSKDFSLPLGISPLKCYFVDNNFLCFCSDGCIYQLKKDGFNKYCNSIFSEIPYIYLIQDGVNKSIVISSKNITIKGQDKIPVELPYKKCCEFNNILYYYNGNKIYYFTQKNININYIDYEKKGFIIVDQSYGQIKEIIVLNNNLYVIASKGIFLLSKEFSLTKITLPILDILDNSVKVIGDVCVFINEKYICKFDGKKIIYSMLLDSKYTIFDSSCTFNNSYMLPIKDNTKKYVLMYILDSNKISYISCDNCLITDNGYAINSLDGNVKLLSINPINNIDYTCKTNNLYFNCFENKILKELSFYAKNNTQITISGDFGFQVFYANAGENIIHTSLVSKKFAFMFKCTSVQFNIENISIKYIVKGE